MIDHKVVWTKSMRFAIQPSDSMFCGWISINNN
jgi:hypothetical protein